MMFVRLCYFFFLSMYFCYTHSFSSGNLYNKIDHAALDHLPATLICVDLKTDEDEPYFKKFLEKAGVLTTRDALVNYLHFIVSLDRYDHIEYHISDDAPDHITLTINRAWLFEKLRVNGLAFNKERIKNSYGIISGDRWDLEKHKESVRQLQQLLHDEGYCNARVTDTIEQNPLTKKVHVWLDIATNARYKIEQVQVQIVGDTTVDLHEIAYLKKKIEKKINALLVDAYYEKEWAQEQLKKIKEYVRHKGYLHQKIRVKETIFPEKDTVLLSYEIKLHQKKEFVIVGCHFFPEKTLIDLLTQSSAKAMLLPPSMLLDEIIKRYKAHGFFDCTGTWSEEHERIVFCMKEGNRYGITKATIKGARYWDEQTLINRYAAHLYNKEFDEHACVHALNMLQEAYQQEGFTQSAITFDFVQDHEHASLIMNIMIQEGVQEHYSALHIEQPELFSEQLVAALTRTSDIPQPVSKTFLEEQKKQLEQYLYTHGYIGAHVFYEYDASTRTIIWKTKSKQPVRFGNTVLTGLSSGQADFLSQEIIFKEGEQWDSRKLDLVLKKFRSFGLYESVTARLHDHKQTGSRDVIIHFIEDDKHEIKVRAGLQMGGRRTNLSFLTGVFGGSYDFKNPFGVMDRFSCDAQIYTFQKEWSISYIQPMHTIIPCSYELKFFGTRFLNPVRPGLKESLYHLAQDGLSLTLTHEFDHTTWALLCGFEALKLSGLSTQMSQALFFEPYFIEEYMHYITCEPTYFYSTVDHPLYPTKGIKLLASMKGMIPLNVQKAAFCKITYEQSFFWHAGPVVWALRLRAGALLNDCFNRIIPSQRYYLGGAFSVRGFETDLVPPLNVITCGGQTIAIPIGGKSMANINAECRFKVYGALQGVVFVDIGALAQDVVADLYTQLPAVAIGYGLRYHTAVGPVRFDMGWPIPGYWKRCNWFLTFGQIF